MLAIAALVRQIEGARAAARLRPRISKALADLREQLFLHFAREEEGLFPFVAEGFPGLGRTVTSMVAAHDRLCGTLSRLIHEVAVNRDGALAQVAPIFSRFQRAYGGHSRRERILLDRIGAQIRPDQREQLTAVVRGL